ncbi:unnamed protein product [Cylicostephanus goldi]|uniref:Uncharacterized protein n=1 Tax=Cylicostephanus goldi TaxID=71465 RepID=A0A3P6RA32_CYLGO|nr:unnamed protein product [Cylicostephanus goldi]
MRSFGITVTTAEAEEQSFMSRFNVQGHIYHRAGSLLSCGNNSPKFLQLCFVCDKQLQRINVAALSVAQGRMSCKAANAASAQRPGEHVQHCPEANAYR